LNEVDPQLGNLSEVFGNSIPVRRVEVCSAWSQPLKLKRAIS
jgi:hypothetical protein